MRLSALACGEEFFCVPCLAGILFVNVSDASLQLIPVKGFDHPCILACVNSTKTYAVAAYEDKRAVCVDVASGELTAVIPLPKRSTALAVHTIRGSKDICLSADKLGDVYAFGLPQCENLIHILGHTASMITDMAITLDGQHLLTSDRDEKIRVTSLPQTAIIESYCMGHRAFITSIDCFAADTNWAVSVAADMYLCVWDIRTGNMMNKIRILEIEVPDEAGRGQSEEIAENYTELEVAAGADEVQDPPEQLNTDGPIPLRVRTARRASLCAVIAKGLSLVHIFGFRLSQNDCALLHRTNICTLAPPSEVFFHEDVLYVISCPPHPVLAYAVSLKENCIEVSPRTDHPHMQLCKHLSEAQVQYSFWSFQSLSFVDIEMAGSSGVKKHYLVSKFAGVEEGKRKRKRKKPEASLES